jgi:hypothetical protein
MGMKIKIESTGEAENLANAVGNAVIIMAGVLNLKRELGEDNGDLDQQLGIVNELSDELFKIAEEQKTIDFINTMTEPTRGIAMYLFKNMDFGFTTTDLRVATEGLSFQHIRFVLMILVKKGLVETKRLYPDGEGYYIWRGVNDE